MSKSLAMVVLAGWIASPAKAAEPSADLQTPPQPLAADVAHGKSLFARHCVACHGVKAYGDAFESVPALAGQRFKYLVRQLEQFSTHERDSGTMHRVVSQEALQDAQARVDIAGYLSHLPMIPFAQSGGPLHLARGRNIYRQHCASCHGDDAGGSSDGEVPSLRDQHFSYLVDQLRRLSQRNRHMVDENLVQFIQSFDDHQMDAVANYLSHLQGPSRPPGR